jgi:aminoglycoside 6'-N-acetyltransferase
MRLPAIPLRGQFTSLRHATDDDVELLVNWHEDPDVSRYWDDETFTHEEMLARLARPDVDAYIIEADGEPVGYLQAWFDPTSTDAGLDMFLVPAARGRGFGPDAARTVASYLVQESGRERLTVDPYLWNEPAIRAWRKAGFRPIEERPPDAQHTADRLLMGTGAKTE